MKAMPRPLGDMRDLQRALLVKPAERAAPVESPLHRNDLIVTLSCIGVAIFLGLLSAGLFGAGGLR